MKNLVAVLFALLSLNAFSQIPDYVPTDGLVGWWSLNGTASDDGAFENHGVLNGPTGTLNRFGQASEALFFDGVNDYVSIPDAASLQITGDLTLSIWYHTSGPSGNYQTFLTKRSGGNWPYSLGLAHYYGSGGCPGEMDKYVTGRRNSASQYNLRFTEKTYVPDMWTHLVLTVSNDSVTFYENGQALSTTCFGDEFNIDALDVNAPLTLGSCNCGLPEWMNGSLDDLGIWNRALSIEEINALYAAPAPVLGCTDPSACNFNPEAFFDDASCIFLELNVPNVCDATSMLECSALVEGIDVANYSEVVGYDFVGSFENSRYLLSQQSFSPPAGWNQQEEFAQSMGGHLADIHSEEENSFIFNSILEAGWNESTWMGMTDAEEEGNWVWTSGQPVTYTNWSPSEPNNSGGGEHWMHMWGDINSSWNDHRNALNTKCLIELPILGILNWNNGQQGLTASYPASTSAVQATLIVDGTELCSAFQTVLVGQGCNDPAACNYSENDSCNVSCLYVLDGVDCGLASSSVCGEGTVWDEMSQTCIVANPSDSNFDGCVQLSDLLDILSVYGMCFDSNSCESVIYQGYDYETVMIGGQCWFAENLRAEHYTNGQPISEVQASADWQQLNSGARAVVGENAGISVEEYNANLEAFGRIYNGYATMDARGLCPSGWHLPSDADWIQMEMHLGLDEGSANSLGYRGDEGGVLKSSEADSPAWNGNNESGWSGLPGGNRGGIGNFNQVNNYGYWWTSTVGGELEGLPWLFFRSLATDNNAIYRDGTVLSTGNSVRCLKDE